MIVVLVLLVLMLVCLVLYLMRVINPITYKAAKAGGVQMVGVAEAAGMQSAAADLRD